MTLTAKQFIIDNQKGVLLEDYILKDMIWFMDNYTEEVLKIAAEKAKIKDFSGKGFTDCSIKVVDKESILNCLKE